MTTVVVGGTLANKPGSSGEAWVRMSWVRGLERLGLDVRFVERLAGPDADPEAVAWFEAVTGRFGIGERATLLLGDEAIAGPAAEDLAALAPEATLVNVSGELGPSTLRERFRRRIFIDLDPGFTQFWHAQGLAGAGVEGHDMHFTVGALIGTPACQIPTEGIDWHPVSPPVVLDDWPAMDPAGLDRFTTISSWRGPFGPIEHGGRTYGLKHHEFRKMIELPQRSGERFEIALDIHPADGRDLEALGANGWRIVDPRSVVGDLDAFRAYVQGSGAEFSVAQGIYVDTRSGWFSDRTTRYLASGRPALVQDTGFGDTLPVGEGLVAFRTLEDAVAGAADIADRYAEHCRAARRIAEEHFDAGRVLARFCEQAGIG
ncbi:MAG: hypothetical protein GEU88_02900 [Solirubrobacterales bacterium]|nr:hypothetical protein [Solirubrobacterales bacterium]